MEFGAHLPLMDFGGHPFTLGHLLEYARTAEHLGFDMLCANDHLVFAVPWLDGPTALAAVIEASGPAGAFADLLAAFNTAGLKRVLLWPVADEARQLELFRQKVAPAV